MEVSAAQLINGIEELFPECRGSNLSLETELGEMPEWDSMAAVNLQTFLLQQFEMEIPLELLADETTLKDVMAFIENPSLISSA